MIFGDCPYEDCKGTHARGVPDITPRFAKHTCETCKREFWLYYSRFEPQAFTLEDFDKKYIADEETRIIKEK